MRGSNTPPHIAQRGVHFSRKVTCLETGKVYESISRFCAETGASRYNINLAISKAEPFVHEGRSYVIEGHGVCLIPASTEGTVARPKYEIGSTVLVRLVADICRCKVSVEKAGIDYSVCLKRDTMYIFLNSVYNHFREQYRELTKNEFNEL